MGESVIKGSPPNRLSVWSKFKWMLKHRPTYFYQAARGYSMFHYTQLSRRLGLWNPPGVLLETNVRVQKKSCVMAEFPDAKVSIGANSVLYENAKIEAYGAGQISIGADSVLGDVRIASRYRVSIGARFLSSWNVFIQDYDSHPLSPSARARQVRTMVNQFSPWFGKEKPQVLPGKDWDFPGEEIVIGDDVWIGANSTILKGARIGSGSIVATGSVVTRGNYPERAILAGNPAEVIKELPE